jgi:CPA2 family monovalent cation:H+ antiporter-2
VEAHAHDLTPIAIVLMVALLSGLGLMRLRQPAIVGYIFAGILLGPTGFGLIEGAKEISLLAELGVIMLLFLIGMELSLRGFKTVYKIAVSTAALQILIFLGIFSVIGLLLGWSIGKILVFGFALSLSSTAVAIKILEETGDLRTVVGRTTVGVLIAQDLAVIPMLLILVAFAEPGQGFDYSVILKLGLGVGFLVGLTWFLSRRERIRLPILDSIQDRPDMLALAGLGICFTLASVSGLLGLSTAYGAFVAGLIIGNSNARSGMHQSTLPIQSVLLMVFFLSIGLLIDLKFLFTKIYLVLPILLIVTVGKTIINITILRVLGEPWERAFQTGVVLGQVGEFSFILIAIALAGELILQPGYQLMITVIALSLMISPLWLSIARRIRDRAAMGLTSLRDMVGTTVPPSVTLPKKIDEMIDQVDKSNDNNKDL